jgi:O-acetyl-ADP-ribose deacetylase (regulator of RNase III)
MNQVIFEKEINGVTLKVIEGDITLEDVEAIVNPANNYLQHGGGVAGAIVRRGGEIIQKESDDFIRRNGPLPTGEATVTSGGRLKARYVIHTVGPRWGEGDEKDKLKKAVKSALEIACENSIKTLSIPAISCGIFGFPPGLGTKIIVETVKEFLQNSECSFEEVHLIGIGKEVPGLFKKSLEGQDG